MQSEKYKLEEFTPCGDNKFTLSKKQMAKLNEWLIGVQQRAAQIQMHQIKSQQECKADDDHSVHCVQRPLPHYGSLGGGLAFTFVPCGIGTSCKVTEAITGESIDLTDFDQW